MTLHLGSRYHCTTAVGSIAVNDCVELLWVDGDAVQVRLPSHKVFDVPMNVFRQCFRACTMCQEVGTV